MQCIHTMEPHSKYYILCSLQRELKLRVILIEFGATCAVAWASRPKWNSYRHRYGLTSRAHSLSADLVVLIPANRSLTQWTHGKRLPEKLTQTLTGKAKKPQIVRRPKSTICSPDFLTISRTVSSIKAMRISLQSQNYLQFSNFGHQSIWFRRASKLAAFKREQQFDFGVVFSICSIGIEAIRMDQIAF